MSVQPPSGTVTFLFTDIEDSPRLWESTPLAMTAAMLVHDLIVRSAIKRHGRFVFLLAATASAPHSRQPWTR